MSLQGIDSVSKHQVSLLVDTQTSKNNTAGICLALHTSCV